jgi:hypothetical protein
MLAPLQFLVVVDLAMIVLLFTRASPELHQIDIEKILSVFNHISLSYCFGEDDTQC